MQHKLLLHTQTEVNGFPFQLKWKQQTNDLEYLNFLLLLFLGISTEEAVLQKTFSRSSAVAQIGQGAKRMMGTRIPNSPNGLINDQTC